MSCCLPPPSHASGNLMGQTGYVDPMTRTLLRWTNQIPAVDPENSHFTTHPVPFMSIYVHLSIFILWIPIEAAIARLILIGIAKAISTKDGQGLDRRVAGVAKHHQNYIWNQINYYNMTLLSTKNNEMIIVWHCYQENQWNIWKIYIFCFFLRECFWDRITRSFAAWTGTGTTWSQVDKPTQ